MGDYIVTYTDDSDPGCPDFTWRVRAYDREHAEQKFWTGGPLSGDWQAVQS